MLLWIAQVDHDVSNSVPEAADSKALIRGAASAHAPLLVAAEDTPVIDKVLELLSGRDADAPPKKAKERRAGGGDGVGGEDDPAFGEEQEQEQEQEEEQEQEQEQQQQKEQEQEVEEADEFKKEKYVRDSEGFKSWGLADLASPPSDKLHGFWQASEFCVHSTFNRQAAGLSYPSHLLFSTDHTHPRWRFTSHRRLKNVLMLLEWVPDVAWIGKKIVAQQVVQPSPRFARASLALRYIVPDPSSVFLWLRRAPRRRR